MKVQPRIYVKTKYNDKLSESPEAVDHPSPLVGIRHLSPVRHLRAAELITHLRLAYRD